jgi:hypothetical protein
MSVEVLSHIGPVAYAHINFRDAYCFPVEITGQSPFGQRPSTIYGE